MVTRLRSFKMHLQSNIQAILSTVRRMLKDSTGPFLFMTLIIIILLILRNLDSKLQVPITLMAKNINVSQENVLDSMITAEDNLPIILLGTGQIWSLIFLMEEDLE
jgi:hypothetical protein